jgi:hypothetical protein
MMASTFTMLDLPGGDAEWLKYVLDDWDQLPS